MDDFQIKRQNLEKIKMPQESLDSYIGQILSKYTYPDKAKRDVCAAIRQYKNLRVKLDTYVFNDGNRQQLACLDGTIPVMYKGTYYHIPVCIWLLDSHPYNSPICYVKPTSDMQIKASRHVDTNGRVYLPYLHNWQPDTSDLLGVIQVMIIVFGETPPVYSKPKFPNSTPYTQTPYPTEPSSFMPMPNVGTTYPPYPPVMGSGPPPAYPPVSTPYAQYPTPYPAATGYTYPPYNSASGGMPATNSYPTTATSTATPPYPPQTTASSLSMQGNTGTITEEHIHASLLSAVEDKLKKRLREVLAQSQAEIEVLKKTEEDLNKGKIKLQEIMTRLQQEQKQLERNIVTMSCKESEITELQQKIESQKEVNIDDAVVAPAPLYNQIVNSFAEENATEDAVYYLGEALRKGVIDLDIFLKHVRALSWKQFMLKALMQKCREKANLPH